MTLARAVGFSAVFPSSLGTYELREASKGSASYINRAVISVVKNAKQTNRFKIAMNNEDKAVGVTKKKSVLFVCLGNICRSPAAEGVFRSVVKVSHPSDTEHLHFEKWNVGSRCSL